MRRLARIAAAALLAAASAAGCLLTTNFDGIVGVPPSPDANVPDAIVEAAGGDAGEDAADGSASFWCDTHPGHALCADFDEDGGTLLGAWWTSTYDQGGGSSSLDTTNYSSPPAAFLSDVPSGGAGGLLRTLPVLLTDFQYGFDFRVASSCTPTSNAAITLASLGFQNVPNNIMGVLLSVNGWLLAFEQPGADGGVVLYTFPISPAPARDAWHTLEFSVTVGGAGHVRGTLDGTSFVDSPLSYAPVQNGTVTLNAGVFGPGPCTADYDNMTFDFNTQDGG
jgi:hypothetical protein